VGLTSDYRLVPNEIRPGARLAIVGEAPGTEEVAEGKPFVGSSGRLLWAMLGQSGITRTQCSVLNVCQAQPPGNAIDAFAWDSAVMAEGRAALYRDLVTAKPNLVLCLGKTALRALCSEPRSIDSWRGSLFNSGLIQPAVKCISTYHPAAVLRQYSWIQLFRFDIARAVRESTNASLFVAPVRTLVAPPTYEEALSFLYSIVENKTPVSIDIEGGVGCLRCISFATSATYSITIPLINAAGTSFWSEHHEQHLWVAMAKVICDPTIPKILQNYLYDAFVLAGFRTPIRGLADDTMLKHWELLPEMEKGLAVQTSLYTHEPFYKDAVSSPNGDKLWRYCATDSAVTFEINEALTHNLHTSRFTGASWHYHLNLALLAPLNYMQVRGVRIDTAKRTAVRQRTQAEYYELQHVVNIAAVELGALVALPYGDPAALTPIVAAQCCYKKYTYPTPRSLLDAPKKDYADNISRIVALVELTSPTSAECGELSSLIDHCVNVDSKPQMAELLYTRMALPAQYKKEKGRRTDKITTDALALLTLYRKTKNETVRSLLRLRNIKDQLQGIDFTLDPDGRCRSGYNVVGTETGRVACYNSSSGTGKSIQTETRRFKCLYIPDTPKHWFFECDLAGADGWTVAAHCARLGDRTMLEDYAAGIKPARVIALIYLNGPAVAAWPREQLLHESEKIDSKGWLYFACKRVQHGTNYGMLENTVSDTILRDSWNKEGEPVYVEPHVCKQLQACYLLRYPTVKRWHSACEASLKATGCLTGASRHTRIFFGRRDDYDTVKEYLADEPQENTTYGTNLALYRLWTDADNRDSSGRIIVEPLFHRHDAIGGQFPVERTDWALSKIREWFNNHLTIAGQDIVIPFEGGYGPSWGELKHPI
jgi:uracil-DNA glycosylase family 4